MTQELHSTVTVVLRRQREPVVEHEECLAVAVFDLPDERFVTTTFSFHSPTITSNRWE